MIPIKNGLNQGNTSLLLLFNFALQCAIGRLQVNQDSLKLNGTYQLLVYAEDVNIMDRNICAIQKNTDKLVVASKVTGL
jgi:hypothetical protein